MAMPARSGMRLLSQRLHHLHRPSPTTSKLSTTHIRLASRYSNPPARQSSQVTNSSQEYVPAFTAPSPGPSSATHDPLYVADPISRRERKNQYHIRRAQLAGVGLVATLIATFAALYNVDLTPHSLDASKASNETFQGKQVHVIGLGEGKRIVAEDESGTVDLVETGTSSVPHFPKVIYLPTASESDVPDPNAITAPNTHANPGNRANMEEYTLLGLGIRSVSFLGIQVYVMGMYVRTTDLTRLQAKLIHAVNPKASTLIPSEKGDLQNKLLDAEASQQIWDDLLQLPGIKTAWRIAPTRNTDFLHLRDGWITGINKRTADVKKRNGNVPSEFDREDFGLSVRSFMSIFKGGKAPKGSVLILSRSTDGGLDVFFSAKPGSDGKEKETQLLGSIEDERISKLIWFNYLAGEKVSSEPARKGVADGCVALASRPVGSAETMVA